MFHKEDEFRVYSKGESGNSRIPRHGDDDFIGPLSDLENHFIRGDGIGSKKSWVLGAPNPHPTIEGIYEQRYRVPTYDGRENFIGYKDIPDPKNNL